MELSIPVADYDTYTGFLEESRDHLDSIEQKVLGLAEYVDPDTVNSLFRALHTIKGIAGFLALTDIQRLAHRLESVFDAIRQGSLSVGAHLIEVALSSLDQLVAMLGNLERALNAKVRAADGAWTASIAEVDYAAGYEELGRLLSPDEAAIGTVPSDQPVTDDGGEMLITPEMKMSFIKESADILDATEQVFLRLEESPSDGDSIAQAFRNIHSFKGNCGFFGYGDLERLSHRLETALDTVRVAGAPLPKPMLEVALLYLDVFRDTVTGLSAGGPGKVAELAVWLGKLDGLVPGAGHPPRHPPLGEILVQSGQASSESVEFALSLQNRPLGQILVDEGLATPAGIAQALEIQVQKTIPSLSPAQAPTGAMVAPSGPQGRAAGSEAKRDIRVDLSKLDLLMDLVGELVISTGMVFNHPAFRDSNAPDLEKISHQLKGVVSDLQGVALGVRMIPIEGTFRKMTRLVHDLSSKIGKKVRLDFHGEATEVDKTVIDLIADPLVHMIRNSIDHGMEDPEERKRAGKDATGVVTLEAGQEGGEILIHVRDDGRGMNRERIYNKALERGLIKDSDPERSDSDVFQFIFQPGFSTAESITATSGRGVGMDVVKSNIDKLGGRILIQSAYGKGSTITLRIPLTLSIIDGMMIRVGDAIFILPLTAVRESISPRPEHLFTLAGGQEMLMLRGRTLPIIRLASLYRIAGAKEKVREGLLIHLESRGASICLAVDELLGQRQVVVKALPRFMANVPGTSSCSILDSGEIALILDVAGISSLAINMDQHQGKVGDPEPRPKREAA